MSNRIFTFFLVVLLGISLSFCGSNKKSSLTEDEWVNLLYDMHVLGLSLSENYEDKETLYDQYWVVLEEKYHMDQQDVKGAYDHLLQDEKKLSRVYEDLLDRLSNSEQDFYRLIEKIK